MSDIPVGTGLTVQAPPQYWCDKHGITDYCITFGRISGGEQKTFCVDCLEEALLKLEPTALVQQYDARLHGRP